MLEYFPKSGKFIAFNFQYFSLAENVQILTYDSLAVLILLAIQLIMLGISSVSRYYMLQLR